jgi:hypothetical protein
LNHCFIDASKGLGLGFFNESIILAKVRDHKLIRYLCQEYACDVFDLMKDDERVKESLSLRAWSIRTLEKASGCFGKGTHP